MTGKTSAAGTPAVEGGAATRMTAAESAATTAVASTAATSATMSTTTAATSTATCQRDIRHTHHDGSDQRHSHQKKFLAHDSSPFM
jgi:hypothetical protein